MSGVEPRPFAQRPGPQGVCTACTSAVNGLVTRAMCASGARRVRAAAAARPPRVAQRPGARAQIAVGAVKELADQAPEKADRVARATEQAAASIAPDIEPAAQRATEMTHEAARNAAKALPQVRPANGGLLPGARPAARAPVGRRDACVPGWPSRAVLAGGGAGGAHVSAGRAGCLPRMHRAAFARARGPLVACARLCTQNCP